MKSSKTAKLVRIFISEEDKIDGRRACEVIVEMCRNEGMAGATVFRGIIGFGANSHMHTAKILRMAENLPLVIEIVDTEQKVNEFLSKLDPVLTEGMVTVEKADIMVYRPSRP